jgi:hypothetical protein
MTSGLNHSRAIFARILALCEAPDTERLPRDVLASWMASSDIEVQGAAYALLKKVGHALKVVPPPAPEDIDAFFLAYLARCMGEDVHGEWTHSRHEAGWEVAGWMAALADAVDQPRLLQLRAWLADLYERGSPEERDALVNAALEHIFERPSLRRLFRDWKDHPVLSQAYKDASLWVKEGGDSPLVGRQGSAGRSRKKR